MKPERGKQKLKREEIMEMLLEMSKQELKIRKTMKQNQKLKLQVIASPRREVRKSNHPRGRERVRMLRTLSPFHGCLLVVLYYAIMVFIDYFM
jgi:hypothetical protein